MTIFHASFFLSIYVYLLNIFSHSNTNSALIYGSLAWIVFFLMLVLLSILGSLVYKIIVNILLLLTSITLYFVYFYNIYINENIVFSAFENDIGLIYELLSFKLLIWILLTYVVPSFVIFSVKFNKITFFQFLKYFIFSFLGCVILIYALTTTLEIVKNPRGSIRSPLLTLSLQYFSPLNTIFFLDRGYQSYQSYLHSIKKVENLSDVFNFKLDNSIKDLNVVFILGETSRGTHWGINDYIRDTTPHLKLLPNLINFKQVSSCDTVTVASLPCIFSRMTRSNHSNSLKESSFVSIMERLGFNISILSLQGYQSFYKYLSKHATLLTKYHIIRDSVKKTLQDSLLLPYIDNIKNKLGNKMILLHTIGSHYAYKDRFESENAKYIPYCDSYDLSSCNNQEIINAYDNSIINTDKFLNNVISEFKNTNAIIFYTSDHGESLGENNIFLHGVEVSIAPKEQFDIPMFIWMSDKFIDTDFGSKVKKRLLLIDKKNQINHDNIFHSVLGCSGVIEPNAINKNLNLCNDTAQ
jgi:KDO II ethanolaminephosphotransferase